MPPPKRQSYTSEDYWNLPEGERAELINGYLYAMDPPSLVHQKIAVQLCKNIALYLDGHREDGQIFAAPLAINLNASDEIYVEPDIMIVCDPSKLDEHGIKGAPDFIAEIVSPSSRKMDYVTKANLYLEAGVREYWIIDPLKKCTTVYHFEEDAAPTIIPFSAPATVRIYGDLTITMDSLL